MSTDPNEQPTTRRDRLSGLDPRELLAAGIGPAPGDVDAEQPHVPGYELRTLLGRGGMGAVYEARQQSLDRSVAIKLIAPEFRSDGAVLDRMEREARAMARLRHSHIVQVYDFLRLEEGGAAIVMEIIHGRNLREVLGGHPHGLPADWVVAFATQVTGALNAAHTAGVVHRDIKPENILITGEDSSVKVMDFGLAFEMTAESIRLTSVGTAVGTPAYMAPEQLEGEPVDPRTDIYSLGKVLYEMLTGKRPSMACQPPHELNPSVPPALSEAVLRAMEMRPSDRYQSAAEMGAALREAINTPVAGVAAKQSELSEEGSAVPSETKTAFDPQAGAPQRSRRAAIIAVSAGLLATTGLMIPRLKRRMERPRQIGGPDWTPLLPGVDLGSAMARGDWRRSGNAIESLSADIPGMLALSRDSPGASYDLRWRFARLGGNQSITLFFRSAHGTGSLEFDAWDQPGLAGLQAIDGMDVRSIGGFQFPIQLGAEYEFLLRIRPDRIEVSHDGIVLLNQNMSGRTLQVTAPWGWSGEWESVNLALGTWNSPARFFDVSLRGA